MNITWKKILLNLSVLTVVGAFTQKAIAWETVLDEGHLDVDIEYSEVTGQWELGIHDDKTGIVYDPAKTLLYLGKSSFALRPLGKEWDFIGVPGGVGFAYLDQQEMPGRITLGVSAEEIEQGVFDENTVYLWLADLKGPGDFSSWLVDQFGVPTYFMSTFEQGLSEENLVWTTAGDHVDYNWGFTAKGVYQVTFVAYASIGGKWTYSEPTIFHFGVLSK